jgi:hypothetical protein
MRKLGGRVHKEICHTTLLSFINYDKTTLEIRVSLPQGRSGDS